MTTTQSSPHVAAAPGWREDPLGRYELRWWDGDHWTADIHSAGLSGVDPLGTEPSENPDHIVLLPSSPASSDDAAATTETWRTRPERIGQFIPNVFFCLILPILGLWYVPKYTMRHEYAKAGVCLVASLAWPFVYLTWFMPA